MSVIARSMAAEKWYPARRLIQGGSVSFNVTESLLPTLLLQRLSQDALTVAAGPMKKRLLAFQLRDSQRDLLVGMWARLQAC